MTVDANGQGLIDFTEMFTPGKRKTTSRSEGVRRKALTEAEAVPAQEVKDLNTVRIKAGYNCKEVSDAAGLTNNFVYRVLMGVQLVSREDFERLQLGLGKLIFKRILDA